MSSSRADVIHTNLTTPGGRDTKSQSLNMKEVESKKYNYASCAVVGISLAVFSLVLFLAVIQYKSEMDTLHRTILTLKSDILLELANDRKYVQSRRFHILRRRDTGDVLIDKTFHLLDRNFSALDDVLKTPLQALENVTSEIIGVRQEIKSMKQNFSKDISRLDQLAKSIPKCTQSTGPDHGEEIVKLVVKLTDTISSLKRVVVLSSLKSTTVRSNVALLHRFECALREALGKVEDRIEMLEGIGYNLTNHSSVLEDSLDDIQSDIKHINVQVKSSKDEIVESVLSKLHVMEEKCTDTDFLKTVYDDLKNGVSGINNSTRGLGDKLQNISRKSLQLDLQVKETNNMLLSLKKSQDGVGKTCAQNGDQALAILDKLDLFNETEAETNYTYVEYCALRHGCVKVKEYKKHCYKVFDAESDTWHGAGEKCALEGGYLVEINSDTEYQNLANFITRTRYYWIGGTDLNSEGSWYWGTSKERVWLNAWRGRNPSNDGGIEHCMHLYANRISWNDANCRVRQSFICERDYRCDGWD